MAFEWLRRFHHEMEKAPGYAEKTLAAYSLGMKANGSIEGVAVEPGSDCCEAMRQLPVGQVYDPNTAPRLPLTGCPQGRRCKCVYRPVMSYQRRPGP